MGARLSAAVLAASLAFALAITAKADAQPTKPHVEVSGDRAGVDAAKLDELIALELGALAARVSVVVVDVHGGRAEIEVRLGDERRKGSVALASVEPERGLALFVAELARGTAAAESPAPLVTAAPSSSSPQSPPPPPPPSPASTEAADRASSPPPPRVESSTEPWRFSVLGTMGARVATSHGALLATPRLEIGARRDDAFRVGAIVRYAYASSDDPLGTVRAHAVAGGAAGTYVLTAGPTLVLGTGPRVEAGVIAGRGDGMHGDASSAFTFAAAWEIELQVRLGGISLLGTAEGGSIIRGLDLRADDRTVLYLSGPFVGLSLGVLL